MQEDYCVEVLHYIDPHLIWVKSSLAQNPCTLEQVGLYGIVPVQHVAIEDGETGRARTVRWAAKTVDTLDRYFAKAVTVRFRPTFIDRRSSIFDSNIHKFGDIYIETSRGASKSLSDVLVKRGLGSNNVDTFHKLLSNGKIKTKLGDKKTTEIIKILKVAHTAIPRSIWEKIISDLTTTHSAKTNILSEAKFKQTSPEGESMDIPDIMANKSKDLEYCKGTEYEYLGRGYSRSSNSSDSSRALALRKKVHKTAVKIEKDLSEETLRRATIDRSERLEKIKQYLIEQEKLKKYVIRDNNQRLSKDKMHMDDEQKCRENIHESKNICRKAENVIEDTNFVNDANCIDKTLGISSQSEKSEDLINQKQLDPTDSEEFRNTNLHQKSFINNYVQMELKRVSSANILWDKNHGDKKKVSETGGDKQKRWLKSPTAPVSNGTKTNKKPEKQTDNDGQIEKYYIITPGDVPYSRLKLQKSSPNLQGNSEEKTDKTVYNNVKAVDLRLREKSLWHEEDTFENTNVIQHAQQSTIKSDDNPKQVEVDIFVDDFVKVSKNANTPGEVHMDLEDQFNLMNIVTKDGNVKLKTAVNDEENAKNEVSCIKSSIIQKRLALMKQGMKKCRELSSDNNGTKIGIKFSIASEKQAKIDDFDLTDFNEEKFLATPEKVNTADVPIFKKEQYQVNPFKYTDSSTSKFVENMLTPQLMVHSKNHTLIKPTFDIKNVHFSNRIHRVLTEMGIKQPMTLQKVSWDTILRGHTFFMVSPRRSGKTMGYIPAVCRLVADQKEINENPGPICVIMCDTAKTVVDIAKKCKAFLPKDKILAGYAGVDLNNFVVHLLNGCDILVSTPCYLAKLLTLEKYPVDLRSLSMVILDGCERIDHIYLDEFKLFYSKIKKMLKTRTVKCIQYVIAATEWCGLMETLAKILTNTVISIGYYQECVIYSNAKTSVSFVMDDSKVAVVLEFLKNIDIRKRTVIACTTNLQVKELEVALKEKNYIVFSGDNDMSVEALYSLNESWSQYSHPAIAPILVCCDLTLSHLNVANANYLVHYSLPTTFSSFCKRFACLINHYKSIFDEVERDVRIKILIDSENTDELPKVLNFMKRCTNNIPEGLNEISEKVLIEKDRKKALSYYPACDGLLAFGECPDFWFCDRRHSFLPAKDTPVDWVPRKGKVIFSILHFHTAAHYSARIMSYTINGKETKLPQTYGTLASKMGMYFLNEKNIKLHGIPQLGDLCSLSLRPNDFERCRVVRILRRCDKGDPAVVQVNLLDAERDEIVRAVDLFHLPDEFKNVSSHVVQIRLANLQPNDHDTHFSELSKDYLKGKLKEAGSLYLRARILLSIGNTILVEQLEACQDLKTLGGTVVRYNFKDLLCDAHACPNDEHLPKLLKLCEACGIKLPEVEEESVQVDRKEKRLLPTPQWAHLEADACPLVYFSSAENPGKFYVRLVQFEDFLSCLTKNIQKHIESAKESAVENIFDKGDYVLAKFPDDSLYYRARIEFMPDDKSSQKPNCFFVDHGEWRSVPKTDLEPITVDFITVLPFQAIECRLIGLEPAGEEWTEWAINFFSDWCFESASDDILKQLYVKYFVKEKAESTASYKYSVVMIDATGEDEVLINNVMINANMAGLKESEKNYIENFKFEKPKLKEDSHIEEIERDDEAAWEKTAEAYEDHHYEAALSEEKFFNSDQFDVEFTNEDLKRLLKPSKEMDSKLPELPSTVSMISGSYNTSSEFSVIESESLKSSEAQHNDCRVEISQSNCSNYEIVDLKPDLDSDDFSSPHKSICSTREQSIGIVETSNEDGLFKSDNSLHRTGFSDNLDTGNLSFDKNSERRPKLTWHQTKTTVTIKVEIAAIEMYQVDIDPKTLKFSTHVHDTDYAFSLELYGCVRPERCTHAAKGLYVLVKLEKLLKLAWRHLTRDGKVRRWIVYDQDALVCGLSDDADEEHVLAEKQRLKDYVLDTMERSETESESDEDFACDGAK